MYLKNLLVDGFIDFGLDRPKPADIMVPQIISDFENFTLDLDMESEPLQSSSRPRFPNEMQNYFYLKRGLWTTEQ